MLIFKSPSSSGKNPPKSEYHCHQTLNPFLTVQAIRTSERRQGGRFCFSFHGRMETGGRNARRRRPAWQTESAMVCAVQPRRHAAPEGAFGVVVRHRSRSWAERTPPWRVWTSRLPASRRPGERKALRAFRQRFPGGFNPCASRLICQTGFRSGRRPGQPSGCAHPVLG